MALVLYIRDPQARAHGVKTWEQVKMLFNMYEVWATKTKASIQTTIDVCKLIVYAGTPIRSITDYFKPK